MTTFGSSASAPVERRGSTNAPSDAPERREVERHNSEHSRRATAVGESNMIARFSHEIRSPLHTILGVAEIMAMSPDLTDDLRAHVETITNESQVLRSMIDDILDVARLSAGQMELANEVFSPSAVLDEVGKSFRLACVDKGLDFSVRADASIPTVVKGDPLRLRQILVNLVSNAVRYTDHGSVRVEATMNIDGSCRFRVSDTGKGIPRSVRAKLFEPFHRGSSGANERDGAGLGLTITKQLVELMDGALGFETGEAGTSFWCDISFGHARRASDLRPNEPPTLVRAPTTAHVLIVDDSEVNRLLASSQLERLGYTFATARGGEEALERLENEHFDAVLMDWHMPGLDGLQATTQWRRTEGERRPLPIVMMTASAMAGDRERCLDAGASDYLSKPVSITDLGSTLAKWIAPNRGVDQRGQTTAPDAARIGALIDELGGVDVVRSILDAFRDTAPHYRTSALEALTSGDRDTVRRCAHTLKSTAKMLDACALVTACEDLEQAGDDSDLTVLVNAFVQQCKDAERQLGTIASSLPDGP